MLLTLENNTARFRDVKCVIKDARPIEMVLIIFLGRFFHRFYIAN